MYVCVCVCVCIYISQETVTRVPARTDSQMSTDVF
jgi:hypothetical protein